ncbi:GlcD FAD FMN-containing dehydrogenase [Pyrenophora tritici-repentis]|uniref:6-hydroxy-D-nicotine oxidase n=2 Tax=Pyrenophora tritici-repentis TaxID=45151 RepID=A0A2W1DLL7_9PLEO|nr:6-hydroxy-D-nicotine oxidase [Pyrenophora tritici-repentis Pt-1C-BFP]KAA8619667.1 6-hydroxy-D-nicotine oxidase [Pyrenophora tritici-repentis]EDU47083.1 6-hydroxy-D-nicotine oxidase [Pyrenophora tritici-repentis Pt-1C-BFP]KAF7571509.1 GlcD, FAD/FMN-containing dehydrogenase [Pyrenophora tritici-repentis]KAG9385266.1 6-hydroxy-D-nicotine oxidase [Pyrenophora tritici-repentis]KAI0579254.1 6-hydroxy-D-nicotine oxidase [Pyrenophora tritici-repentis]
MELIKILFLLVSSLVYGLVEPETCRCFPGDACWPSDEQWSDLNKTVSGRLIKTVPLGYLCHGLEYDEAECKALASVWKKPTVHINSSSSIQAPIFANASCDPFTPTEKPCLMGNYVYYAVKVAGANDVAATILFAEKYNIRLVIRNTAHDYVGRSTGAGGLAIWTHFLKETKIVDWEDDEYTGKAITIGAGVQGSELQDAINTAGLVGVTGECPTVGIAGGYIQSGGHSPLATSFGLGADQTLAFNVVTANGEIVTASPAANADLFWALSGSGAGNYGIVVSVTLKVHPDAQTSGASFAVEASSLDPSQVLNLWHKALPAILEGGNMATYYAKNTTFVLQSLTGFNRTIQDLEIALSPFIASLAGENISLKPNYTTFGSYHDHYLYYFGPLPEGLFGTAGSDLIGGRFLLRDALQGVGTAINASVLSKGGMFIGQSMNVSRFASATRAVHPQWRHAVVMSSYSLPYSFDVPFANMQVQQDRITQDIMPAIEAVTPDAGAYINEADYQQPNWQNIFYGSNYARLEQVKMRYDPKGLFWNSIAVGSEEWKVAADGRLCKA